MKKFTTTHCERSKMTGFFGVFAFVVFLFSSTITQAQISCGLPKALTTTNFPGTQISISTYEGVCLLCGPQNTANVINGNTDDYAEMRFGASLGAKNIIGVKAPVVFPAGTYAGMAYNPQVGTFTLVGLDILGNVKVSTYLSGQQQESQTSSNLINGDILDFFGGRNTLGFTTALPFDEIRIEQTATIGLLSNSAVYHAVVQTGCFQFQGCPSNATVESGSFVANGIAGQTGSIAVPISNPAAGPVSVSVSGGGFSTTPTPLPINITASQTNLTIPVSFNGSGTAGTRQLTVSVTSSSGVQTCQVNVSVTNPVTPAPSITSSPNPPTVGQPSTLTASGCTGGTITWFNNGVQIGSGSPYTVANTPSGASYTAVCTINGIASNPSNTITTPTKPNAPTIGTSPNPLVIGQAGTLTANGCAGTVTWYNNGTQVGTGSPLNIPSVPANASYTSTCTVNGVSSDPSSPVVTGDQPATTPTVTSNPNPPVAGSPATLTATGCAGTVNWLANGVQVATGSTYTVTPATAGINYTATCTAGGNTSPASTPVTSVAPPVVNPPSINSNPSPLVVGSPAQLTASGCAGTVSWYNNGTFAGTGSPFTINSVPANASYTATCTVNGVASQPSTPITSGSGTVNPPSVSSNPNPPVAGQSVTLTATGCTGTVTWLNNGSQVGTGASFTTTAGTAGSNYTATCTVNGVASNPSTPITVVAAAVADLAVAFTTNPGSSFASAQSRQYVVTVRNLSTTTTSAATTLSISSIVSGFSVTGGGSQNIGALAPGGQQTFSVTLLANSKGASGALGALIPASADNNSGNNAASVSVSVQNP